MTKQLKLSALVAALLVSASAFAAKPGYTADQSTGAVTRNSYNECWHTNYFDKATEGLVECGDRAPEPAPVASTPEAPQTVRETAKLSADALFDFSKDTLKAEGKQSLNELIGHIKTYDHLKNVEIEGYTDSIGKADYNQKLSQRRANAVKTYLVAGGIPADQINATGKGPANSAQDQQLDAQCKADPKNKYRKGRKSTKALQACLAPNRRVEVISEYEKIVTK